MRNVLMIAHNFPPMGGGGVQRSAKFAKYLPAFGYRPLVTTTSTACYAQHSPRDPSLLLEIPEACRVARVANYGFVYALRLAIAKLLGAALSRWLFWPDGQIVWSLLAVLKALDMHRRYRAHLIYVSIGPASSVVTGVVLKQILAIPLILDFRDPWTQNPFAVWPSHFHYEVAEELEASALAAADLIIMNTPTAMSNLLARYSSRFGQDFPQKVRWLPNGYDEADFPGPARRKPKLTRRVLYLVHTGSFYGHYGDGQRARFGLFRRGHSLLRAWIDRPFERVSYSSHEIDFSAHSPVYLFRALRQLVRQGPDFRSRFRVLLAGVVHPGVRRMVRDLGLGNCVRLLGYLPHAKSVRLLRSADLLFLTHFGLPGGERNPFVGGKTYEYMATGKPILALLPEGDARDFVLESGSGVFCPATEVSAIKDTLVRLYQQHVSEGIRVSPTWEFIKQFERRRLSKALAEGFDECLAS